jgi:hypothetical protein
MKFSATDRRANLLYYSDTMAEKQENHEKSEYNYEKRSGNEARCIFSCILAQKTVK